MFKLKELRIENGLKRSEFARRMGLPASTVANYENETRQAPYETLVAIAEFFDVSIDYLLGRTDDFGVVNEKKANEAILSSTERDLIAYYRTCSGVGKSRILEYAQLVQNKF